MKMPNNSSRVDFVYLSFKIDTMLDVYNTDEIDFHLKTKIKH